MEDWQKNFFEMVEAAADEFEQFFQKVTDEFVEVVEVFHEISEEITEHLQNTLFNEVDQFLDRLVGSIFEEELAVEESLPTEEYSELQYVSYVQPSPQKYAACMGCRNYHGHVYGGSLLVCGMHPYGWDGESCPDWEAQDFFNSP